MPVIIDHIMSFASPQNISLEELLNNKGMIKENANVVVPGGRTDQYKPVTKCIPTLLDMFQSDVGACHDAQAYYCAKGYKIGVYTPDELKVQEMLIQAGFQRLDNTIKYNYVDYARPYTAEELPYILTEPISFSDNGTKVTWYRDFSCYNTPAWLISYIFPDIEFDYKEIIESHFVCHITIQNGEIAHDYLAEQAANKVACAQ